MDPPPSFVIHDILPTEILEMIFIEHAILEWNAPSIDGRVCRVWRRIVLNTPRAWAYFTIRNNPVSIDEVRLRLQRSGAAPVHIDIRDAGKFFSYKLYDLLSYHHTRIASLRARYCSPSFFEDRDFPSMRLLDVRYWHPTQWGSMPKLQSLRLCDRQFGVVPLNELAPLKELVVYGITCAPALRHSQSLTTVMLSNIHFLDTISGPLAFPSLTYLSLIDVRGLKPHVNAPRLVTYHEGYMRDESFNHSLLALVEYGVYPHSLGPAAWHLSFPNIQRLAIRAEDLTILSIFTSLANQPHLLPTLQTIGVGNAYGKTYYIAEAIQEKIESLVLVRNEACDGNVVVCFETQAPFQIPIFFGTVGDLSIKRFCALLTHVSATRPCLLKTHGSQVLACSHSSSKL